MAEIDEMKDGLLEAHAHYLLVQRAEQAHKAVEQEETAHRAALRQAYESHVADSIARTAESAKAPVAARAALETFQREFKARFGITIDLTQARPVSRTAL